MDDCAAPGQSQPPAGNKTGRTVTCVKFQKTLPGLDAPPWPGELGQRIFESVSAQAWKLWEDRQKMILNEYRLMPWQKEAQELIGRQMEDFFFGAGAALPPGYVHSKLSNAESRYSVQSQSPRVSARVSLRDRAQNPTCREHREVRSRRPRDSLRLQR
jgi:Fe-S cluster biosynthesis and repair protein YggX